VPLGKKHHYECNKEDNLGKEEDVQVPDEQRHKHRKHTLNYHSKRHDLGYPINNVNPNSDRRRMVMTSD